jgi:lipooligosaccharide transport system permease protein
MGALQAWLGNYRFSPTLAYRVWQREVDVYKKLYRSTILGGLADPVIYLLAMGLGLGAYVSLDATRWAGVPYIQFLAPGLVASSAMMTATYEVTWNAYMRIHTERVYAAMLTTPAGPEDIVVGELLWAATRSAIYAAVMLVVLFAFGLLASPLALLTPFLAAVGGLAFASLGLAYTSAVKHMDQLIYWYTLFITPMLLLSGVFFPLDALPPLVAQLAWWLPLFHLVEATRALTLGVVSWELVGHLAWLGVATLLVFPGPVALLRRKLVK